MHFEKTSAKNPLPIFYNHSQTFTSLSYHLGSQFYTTYFLDLQITLTASKNQAKFCEKIHFLAELGFG